MSEAIARAAGERAGYIHIPFCHRRCPYCDFAVVDLEVDATPIERYVDAVVAEIERSDDWDPLHAVNIGGGTPSILSADQIATLLDALRNRFGFVAGAEIDRKSVV